MSWGTDQQHVPPSLDPAHPVAEAVDGGVELVVAAHGDEPIPVRGVAEARRAEAGGNRELRLAARRIPDPLARRVAAVEAAGRPQPRVEVVKLVRIGLRDCVADQPVVADPVIPPRLGAQQQRRLGEARDDRGLGQEMIARRLAAAMEPWMQLKVSSMETACAPLL